MSTEYLEETEEVELPAAGGIPAYLKAFEYILNLPRVQRVLFTLGRVEWTRYRREDEPKAPVDMDLESVLPYSIIRSHEVQEVLVDALPHPVAALSMMFARCHMDGYIPLAFVVGSRSYLPLWYGKLTGVVLPQGSLHGYPVLADDHIDAETLIMCSGLSRRATLVDTLMSYKITLPRWGSS